MILVVLDQKLLLSKCRGITTAAGESGWNVVSAVLQTTARGY